MTEEELQQFFDLLPEEAHRAYLKAAIDEQAADQQQLLPENETRTKRILQRLDAAMDALQRPGRIVPAHRVHFMRRWGWAAASLLLLVAAGGYFMARHHQPLSAPGPALAHQDIAPGRQGAILTLANGKTIVLDSAHNGLIAYQNGTQVVLNNGGLDYKATGQDGGAPVYNTMTTPRGRQFYIKLPDGTGVWLNSASSLRYPTVFSASERRVVVSGEAYFEVALDIKRPFKVVANNKATIEVLGTQFNINAYDNEKSLNTTLLEGAVRVTYASGAEYLKPGQQLQLAGKAKVVEHADLERVMAWKNGLFDFNDKSLPEVMKELERWYDIDVEFPADIPNIEFFGKINRNISLNGALKALERSGVHFKLENNRKLIVLP
ncbi:FecR family protein [Chitinophaga costaii]|uniref:FecR family protein n=1 Tax=Chitinophaga costaii TaxID=1335309 RepID=UPI00196A6CBF|nr:FecR family protein [Chitinophaga costaii]